MKRWTWLGMLGLLALGAGGLSGQDEYPGETPEARIWLDRGDQPLLQRGDRVRVYYRTAADAFVAIFHIDTDGAVQLLHPRAPEDDHFARAERDYRLLFPQSSYWFVDEYPGKGYFFVVASPEPLDFGAFGYRAYERGWDLTAVGRSVYRDPYLAMDDYVAQLIPDWQVVPYALDFITYDVGEVHDYPRFLCYDCHGYRTYAAWNPYSYACASFRVVVWDDPYFYPPYRYQGTRVVFAQPRRGIPQFEFKERAVGETWSPVTRTRQPPLRPPVQYAEPSAAQASPSREWVPPRRPTQTVEPDRRAVPADVRARPAPSTSSGGGTGIVAPPRGSAPGDPTRGGSTPSEGARGSTGVVAPPRTGTQAPDRLTPTPPKSGSDRPVLQRRPTTPTAKAKPRGGGGEPVGTTGSGSGSGSVRPPSGGVRGVMPSRPNTSSRPPGNVTPPRSSGGAPQARPSPRPSQPKAQPSTRPSGGSRGSTPPPRRKPGGGSL